jgi:elongation factor 1-alpha
LIYDLGGIPEREMEKLRQEAKQHGKESFEFAFYMDNQEEERRRGITIKCTTKEFFTPTKHYTIIDAPGHKDFLKNMVSGASQADVAIVLVPADGGFATAVSKENGQSRQHALILFQLGIKQLIVGVNKMDSAKYSEEKFNEVRDEARNFLRKVGWSKKFVEQSCPIIPYSGFQGENLTKTTDKMPWWKGADVVTRSGQKVNVVTMVEALEKYVEIPKRVTDKPMRVPISGVFNKKGTGDILTGRVEQGICTPGSEVVFIPTHTQANSCNGKIFSIEMHHKSVKQAGPGDNVGMNIKGLDKNNMPHVGDVMILKSDTTLKACKSFTAQVQVLTHPGELKVGYCPIGLIRTAKAPIKLTKINWRKGKETGGEKKENEPHIKQNDLAEVEFQPTQPFVVQTYKECDPLARLLVLEGNSAVMLGKIVKVEYA